MYEVYSKVDNFNYKEYRRRIPELYVFDTFYNQPHRRYHNCNHLKDLHDIHNTLKKQIKSMDYITDMKVLTAILWHDLIYDVGSTENERLSAELFNSSVSVPYGMPNPAVYLDNEVYAAILNTKHLNIPHIRLDWALYFTDLDLAGIGSDYKTFSRNTELIREEAGSTCSDRIFASNRIKFWEMLLARSYIYHNPYNLEFFKEAEQRGRKNIATEVGILQTLVRSV